MAFSIAAYDVPKAFSRRGMRQALAFMRVGLLVLIWSLVALFSLGAALSAALDGAYAGIESLGQLLSTMAEGFGMVLCVLAVLSSVAYFFSLPIAAYVALFPRSRLAEIARRYADIDSEIVALGRKARAWVGGSKPKVRDIISPPIAVPAR
jgi:hypothetical protein